MLSFKTSILQKYSGTDIVVTEAGEPLLFLHTLIFYNNVTDGGTDKEQQMNKNPFMYKQEPLYINALLNQAQRGWGLQHKVWLSNCPFWRLEQGAGQSKDYRR